MDIHGYSQCYDRYGGSAIYSFVGDLLTVRLGDYGTAVESIELTAYLPSPKRNPRRTLEALWDQFHGYLKTLPKVTFRRKLKRVEIGFLSAHFNADDEEGWKPSADKCNTAAAEIAGAMPLLKKRIKPTDDFDVDRFLADALQLLSGRISSLQEWEHIQQQATEKRQAVRATKSPWDLLEIDWDEYHSKAREILDDPFFWENANDLAPHGNDTGADLLADFKKWDKRNPNISPLVFLDRLLKDWEIEPVDWTVTGEAIVRRLQKDQPIPLSVCNQAAVGLAFAALKLRAACPPEVAQMALAALVRTGICVKDGELSDEIKASWDEATAKMRGKLESFAL